MRNKADTYCGKCIKADVCGMEGVYDPATTYCAYRVEARPHGECKTCKHFVKGGLDGKTYVCEHPDIVLDDHFDYACIEMNEDDFCSRYVPREGDPDDRA